MEETKGMIFVGDDWAEAHHDVCLMDEGGTRLAARRLPEGLPGVGCCMRWLLSTHRMRGR